MAEAPQDLTFTFDEEDTKPTHGLPLPTGWRPVRCNGYFVSSPFQLTDQYNKPEDAGWYSEQLNLSCEAMQEYLPPIDPAAANQYAQLGQAVEWDKKFIISLPMYLVKKDEQGNVTARRKDLREAMGNRLNTNIKESYSKLLSIGVPHGDIPSTDPQTGEQSVKKQMNISAFKNEVFLAEFGEPQVSKKTNKVYANIVDMMSRQQWAETHEAAKPAGTEAKVEAPIVETPTTTEVATPPAQVAPTPAAPTPTATPEAPTNGGESPATPATAAAGMFASLMAGAKKED